MKIVTEYVLQENTEEALVGACSSILSRLGAQPELVIVYYTEGHDADGLYSVLKRQFPGCNIHGCSSCQGVMTESGFHSNEGSVIGIWALSDPDGGYCTVAVPMEDDPVSAGKKAVIEALAACGRPGEMPELIWINATPGHEEQVIQGIMEVVGVHVPIAGGSAADNSVAGNWSLLGNDKIYSDGLVISLFYPEVEISYFFHSGYSPTGKTGIVTRANNRLICEIDGQPAAEVYNRWAGSLLDPEILVHGGNVLTDTTLHPLGRHVDSSSAFDHYNLSHPESVTSDGCLRLFSEFHEGERVVLMQGSNSSLINRAGRVAATAMRLRDFGADSISGALVIYCAGCMLTVHDSMDDVAESICEALGGAPFMGAFTFGEQGCIDGAGNSHGNLMISTVIFGR